MTGVFWEVFSSLTVLLLTCRLDSYQSEYDDTIWPWYDHDMTMIWYDNDMTWWYDMTMVKRLWHDNWCLLLVTCRVTYCRKDDSTVHEMTKPFMMTWYDIVLQVTRYEMTTCKVSQRGLKVKYNMMISICWSHRSFYLVWDKIHDMTIDNQQ